MAAKSNQQGFSLIETIIAIVIFLILIATFATVLVQEFQVFSTGQSLINADWQGRIALNRMIRDIREATTISTAESNILTFHHVDDDSNINTTYSLNGHQLIYSKSDSALLFSLIDDVNTLTFEYYNQDGVKLVAPIVKNSIRYITINLKTVDPSTAIANDLTTAIYLWNSKN